MEKGHAERSLHALGKDASQTLLQNEDITPRLLNDQKDPERQRSAHSNCNQGEYRQIDRQIYGDNNLITFSYTFITVLFQAIVFFFFVTYMSSAYLLSISSADQPPCCRRVSLFEAGATAGSHEEDAAQCQNREDQPA